MLYLNIYKEAKTPKIPYAEQEDVKGYRHTAAKYITCGLAHTKGEDANPPWVPG